MYISEDTLCCMFYTNKKRDNDYHITYDNLIDIWDKDIYIVYENSEFEAYPVEEFNNKFDIQSRDEI